MHYTTPWVELWWAFSLAFNDPGDGARYNRMVGSLYQRVTVAAEREVEAPPPPARKRAAASSVEEYLRSVKRGASGQ